MQKNRIVVTSDPTNTFFVAYKCVNDVSSYGTYYFQESSLDEKSNSVHLRCEEDTFVDQMTRRLHPLYDSSSHLAFPTTSLNNVTTRGWDLDAVYYSSIQSGYLAFAFGRLGHIQTRFSTNNRNYTALIHGIENRSDCLLALEKMDSIKFSRNCSFPPLTWNALYPNKDEEKIMCRSQIYDNSFATNTQRQTDESLVETSRSILSRLMKFAAIDLSINHLCVDWEIRLGRNLSYSEKCQLLIFHEVARNKHACEPEKFQLLCEQFPLKKFEDNFNKNMYGVKRLSRKNPELVDIYYKLPQAIQEAVKQRWKKEGKSPCPKLVSHPSCACKYPSSLKNWNASDIDSAISCFLSKQCTT